MGSTKPRKTFSLKSIGIALLVVAICGISWTAVHKYQRRSLLPERPDLSSYPPGLQTKIDEAEKSVARLRPPADCWLELGKAYLANGFNDPAKEAFEAHLAESEESRSLAIYFLGYIDQEQGRLQEAVTRFQEVLRQEASYLPAHLRLAESLFKQGRNSEAEAAYRAVLAIEADNDIAIVGLARILRMDNKVAEAKDLVMQNYQRSPTSIRLGRAAIRLLEQAGDSETAAEIRSRLGVWDEPPMEDPWLAALVDLRFDLQKLSLDFEDKFNIGRVEEAFSYLERIEKIGQAPERAAFLRGYAYSEMGLDAQAVESLELALRIGSDPGQIYPILASSYIDLKRFADAEKTATKGIAIEPKSVSLRLLLGIATLEQGRATSAKRHFKEALEIDPKNLQALRNLSRIYLETRDTESAIEALQRIRSAAKDDFLSRAMLGQTHLELGSAEDALPPLAEAYALQPDHEETRKMLSFAHLKLGNKEARNKRYAEAFENYQRSIDILDTNPDPYINRANLLASLGRFDESKASIEKLLLVEPNNAHALLIYGDISIAQKQPDAALDAWEKARDLARKAGQQAIEREATTRLEAER